jgi:putative toxin-antitoxin system antitoxin component (TIGR02293 family)
MPTPPASTGTGRILDDLEERIAHPVRAIRKGLPYAFYERLAGKLDASDDQLARVLSITPRTLRRRRRSRGRLTPGESDRLWLLAQVFEQAAETFDGEERARRWLAEPHRMLGGESPLEHLDTTAGADRVRYILHQIEHSMPV